MLMIFVFSATITISLYNLIQTTAEGDVDRFKDIEDVYPIYISQGNTYPSEVRFTNYISNNIGTASRHHTQPPRYTLHDISNRFS